MIPGLFPQLGGRRGGIGSFIFNGSNEDLRAEQVGNATDRTRCTISFWLKCASLGIAAPIIVGGIDIDGDDLGGVIFAGDGEDAIYMNSILNSSVVGSQATDDSTVVTGNVWTHYVCTWDTNQSSGNRIRFWINGVEQAKFFSAPGSSAIFHMFDDGHTILVGGDPTVPDFSKRLAFIDVLDGVAGQASDFAFTNVSTWTRKPYVGSYGSNGFRLDGSTGFTDSANGRSFTGTNMTEADNISFTDLPPYTT